MSKKNIRVCDICHKSEGRELKSSDFVNDPLKMTMNGIDGDELTIACNIVITRSGGDPEYIVDDVVNDYSPMVDMAYVMDEHPFNLNALMAEKQLNNINASIDLNNHGSDICKLCFNNMVKMVSKYAKWDKVVKF